jgi:hypothetical protein
MSFSSRLALALSVALVGTTTVRTAHADEATPATPAATEAPAAAPAAPEKAPTPPEKAPAPEAPAAAAAPATGTAGSVSATAKDKPKGPPKFPLHLFANLTQSLGSGTFVINPNNPTTQTALSINPFLVLGDWAVTAQQGLQIEETQSDSTTSPNQVELSDTRLGVSYRGLRFEDIEALGNSAIYLQFNGSYGIPISLGSRQAGSVGTTALGTRAIFNNEATGIYSFAHLDGSYSLLVPGLAERFASQSSLAYDDRTNGNVVPQGCIVRDPSELASYACGRIPSLARWSTGLVVGWGFGDGHWSASAGLDFTQSFRAYDSPKDQFTANNAVAGVGHSEATSGDISLTYIPQEWLWITLGAQSNQPVLTSDNKGVRFPFWDFLGPYNNFSSLYVDMMLRL